MSFTKKVTEDMIKDVRNSINDLSKTLDIACDPSQQIAVEIIEYYKKRIEIENDYGSHMLRLGEKLGEKVHKIAPLIQFNDGTPDNRYELYHLLKLIEGEVINKAKATMKYSETISNHIIPAINKYNDFNTIKLNKNRKILSTVSEYLVQGINTIFNKNQIYYKNVLNEQKSYAEYDSYNKSNNLKTDKNPEKLTQKLMTLDQTYKEDIINTDRSRNQYIFEYYSSKRCQDRFFKYQTSRIVSTTNLKFGEFWRYFLNIYTSAIHELNYASNTYIKNYDKLVFSDDVESEVFLKRYKSKFLEKSVKFPRIISKNDRANKVMSYGPLKAELENDLCIIHNNIKKIQDELSESLKLNTELKESKIQWDKCRFALDSVKESKNPDNSRNGTQIESFDYNEYFQTVESLLTLELSFYNERTKLSWIKTALDNTSEMQHVSTTLVLNDKNRMEFGVDIVQHCTIYNVKIPAVVTLCSKYLFSNDLLKTVGIFRISPSISNVKEIIQFIAENGYIKEESSAATVSSIMKQYLRSMKNFINIADFPKILSGIAYTTKNKFIEETRKIMDQLSIQSRDLLIFIAKFLRYVAKMSDINKMNLQNLTIVFGQTLFSQEHFGENSFDNQTHVNAFFKLFCERIFEIFPDQSTILEFDEGKNSSSEENTWVDILDDGDNFDNEVSVKEDVQNKESSLSNDTTVDEANSFSNISITDLPHTIEQSKPNKLRLNLQSISEIGSFKIKKKTEKNNRIKTSFI